MIGNDWSLGALLLISGLITFAIRYSFIGVEGIVSLPSWFRRWLPLVPVAALTALIAPDVVVLDGQINLGISNPRLVGGIVAIAVAAIWRNTLLTITLGFVAFSMIKQLG